MVLGIEPVRGEVTPDKSLFKNAMMHKKRTGRAIVEVHSSDAHVVGTAVDTLPRTHAGERRLVAVSP